MIGHEIRCRSYHRGLALIIIRPLAKQSFQILLIIGVFVLIVAAVSGVGLAQDETAQVIVSNEDDGTVTVLAGKSLQVVATIRVGTRPHNLAVLRSGLLLVANWGSTAVSVIDLAARREVRRISLGVAPHDVAASSRPNEGYILSEQGALFVVDAGRGRILRRTTMRGRPHDLAVVAGDAWVTDLRARRLLIMDGQSGAAFTDGLPAVSHDLALRPGGREVWITPWSGNRVMIVDARSRRLRAVVRVGSSPQHLAFTPDGRTAWIAETATGKAYMIDAERRRILGAVDLGGPPHHVAVDERRAYFAVGPSHLIVVDTRRQQIITRVMVGADPHDVVLH